MNTFAAFFRVLGVLLLVTVVEKLWFAAWHEEVRAGLGMGEVFHALAVGLRFDLAIAAIFAFLVVFAAHVCARLLRVRFMGATRVFAAVAVIALVLIHGADLLYFAETGRHMGYELKEAYNSGTELAAAAVVSFLRPVLAQLVFLALALWLMGRALPVVVAPRQMFARPTPWWRVPAPELKLVAVLAIAVVLTRGGLQSVPLEPLHAQELGDPNKATLALNGAYNAVFSSVTPYSVEPVLRERPTETDYALVRELLGPAVTPTAAPDAARPNVVIVFLESWSAYRMASYGGARQTTPRFDALRTESLTTRDMLAGGKRTTEGMFATLCSAQNPLGATVAQTQLQNYRYDCLPKILRESGYHSAFFQGTVSGTSGTGAFAQLLGFELSFGKEHVADSRLPHNSWGMHDPDLYRFTLEKLATLPQPFLAGVNTNSTHDHLLPDGHAPAFANDSPASRYDNVLHFADAAFGEFVEQLFARFPNTILVAVADHAGYWENPLINRYRIPFLIHAPGRVTPAMLDVTASQRDVAPTLLTLLGLPVSPWFSGQPLTLASAGHAADYYHAGLLGWTEGTEGLEFPLRHPEDVRCFDPADLAPKPCSEHSAARRDRALAFTRVMQKALFSGELGSLAGLRPVPGQ
ncbi:MAG: LTA synthase family protein [Thiohalomonadaceae bacterium]